jgi:hypothetical protein
LVFVFFANYIKMPLEVIATIRKMANGLNEPDKQRIVDVLQNSAGRLVKTGVNLAQKIEVDSMGNGTIAFIVVGGVVVLILAGAFAYYCYTAKVSVSTETLTSVSVQHEQSWFNMWRLTRSRFGGQSSTRENGNNGRENGEIGLENGENGNIGLVANGEGLHNTNNNNNNNNNSQPNNSLQWEGPRPSLGQLVSAQMHSGN